MFRLLQLLLFVLPFSVSAAIGSSYLGTDLCFTHIIKYQLVNSNAEARPNFNVFYLNPINKYSLFIADIHYQWNTFNGGNFIALKAKTDIGLKQDLSRMLFAEYIGIAPTLLFINREYTETSGSYYYSYTEKHKINKNGMAIDFIIGFRHILRQNSFFCFGWTAEYSYLLPFFNISSILINANPGLGCVKAGFSFSFQIQKK